MSGTIFVQIAAYRDNQLVKTIKDCLEKAKFPENLVFSICWQHSKEDVWDNLDEFKGNPQFHIIDIDNKETQGVCWARNLLQQKYNGEQYTLQLDSHHRFVQNFDVELIDMHTKLMAQGVKKPLLTSYAPGYDPETEKLIHPNEVWSLAFNRFAPDGLLHLEPHGIPNPESLKGPVKGRLYSAHYAFASGDFVKEVPHDPEFYFHGEEPAIAVRAFTHGYDIYHPHKCLVYHYYERKGHKRHWDDVPAKHEFYNSRAHDRFRRLLGVKCEPEDFGIYGLGKERTLEDYARYTGIRYSDCRIQQYTLKNYPPPNPKIALKKDYEESFLKFYRHCIDIGYHEIPGETDYWVVAFLDEHGQDIPGSRQDADPAEVKKMLSDPSGYAKIWRSFYYDIEPVKFRVWPHAPVPNEKTDANGFYDRIERDLKNPSDYYKEPLALSIGVAGPLIKIENASAEDVEKGNHFDAGENSMLIQILDEGYAFPVPKHKFKEVYEFHFCDHTTMRAPYGPASEEEQIQKEQADAIAKLLRRAKELNMNIVVHCLYGRCRSTGVCEAAKTIGFELVKNSKDYYPNDRVARMIKEAISDHERDVAQKRKVTAGKSNVPDMMELYNKTILNPYKETNAIATIGLFEEDLYMDTFEDTILVHLPAYREPELIPTITDALRYAMNPGRIRFGICRQYEESDGFDNLDVFRNDERFKIYDMLAADAKGLPWARGIINDQLLTDEDYVLQLDSHHRFVKDWDAILISMHNGLEKKGVAKPIITGYTPQYSPLSDPETRVMEPWMSGFRCFYPFGTIFIGPQLLHGWEEMTEPARARFLCGHFDFARAQWARDVRHDPTIYFAGEEINLTVRSFTHGYDFYHPHRMVLWHATMREERSGICKWDDDNKRKINFDKKQNDNRRMIMKLFGAEDHPDIELNPVYGLGTERTVADYERFAGLNFKNRTVQPYTYENKYPPNPIPIDGEDSYLHSFYYSYTIYKEDFPGDYSAILMAFDDATGNGVYSEHLTPNFHNGYMHNVVYFTHDPKRPVERVVFWAIRKSDGQWAERKEYPPHFM